MSKYLANHWYNIQHLDMLSMQLSDIAKDYANLYQELQAYKKENVELSQKVSKLMMLKQ